TTGLDPGARRRMWRSVEQLQAEGVTILLVSHAMDEVARLCDRIVLLDRGRVLTSGAPAQVVTESGADSLEDAFVALTGHELPQMQVSACAPEARTTALPGHR